MKRIITKLLAICLLLALPSVSFAHSPNTGGESSKWSVDAKNHAGKTNVTYRIDSTVNSANIDYTKTGAGRWSSSSVSFSLASSGYTGVVTQYSDPNASTLAAFSSYVSNTSGHLTSWRIKINEPVFNCYSPTLRYATMAHEFGHAVGLNDLYYSSNTNVLMYGGISGWTAYSPTSYDKTGATESSK